MNRIIKFRAWDKKNKVMINNPRFLMTDNDECKVASLTEEKYDVFDYLDGGLYCYDAILMQYTGLLDKNGKEIYEGDVIEINKDLATIFEVKTKGTVTFDCGTFRFGSDIRQILPYFVMASDITTLRGEIIGNIYENPELLSDNK